MPSMELLDLPPAPPGSNPAALLQVRPLLPPQHSRVEVSRGVQGSAPEGGLRALLIFQVGSCLPVEIEGPGVSS